MPVQRKASERDIDLDFWAEEAALLGVEFSCGSAIVGSRRPKARPTTSNAVIADSSRRTKKRGPDEDDVPLSQVSDTVLANRVSKMLRKKAKTIGDGLDPPWPSERARGPQRHPKWIHTLHVDSHNHSKLAFYAEISPTARPVIAGFPPEQPPPDLIPKPETPSPPSKKRKSKADPSDNTVRPADQPEARETCRRATSMSAGSSQQDPIQEQQLPGDDQGSSIIQCDGDELAKDIQKDKNITQGFQELKEQLEIQKSCNHTNSEPEQEEYFHTRPAVKIEVPDHLKAILVDDWENVTKNLSLVPIPADHPVSEILSTYFEEEKGKRRLGSAEADLLEEVVQGTKDYFEQCLGKLLLYRFEREQYFRLHQALEKGKAEFEGRPIKDKKISDIYGAEHLCRLFGESPPPLSLSSMFRSAIAPNLLNPLKRKTTHTSADEARFSFFFFSPPPVSLPELIAQTNMDAQSVSKLRQEIQALTAWLGKNSTRFFTAEYEVAPQEYVEKARGL